MCINICLVELLQGDDDDVHVCIHAAPFAVVLIVVIIVVGTMILSLSHNTAFFSDEVIQVDE